MGGILFCLATIKSVLAELSLLHCAVRVFVCVHKVQKWVSFVFTCVCVFVCVCVCLSVCANVCIFQKLCLSVTVTVVPFCIML